MVTVALLWWVVLAVTGPAHAVWPLAGALCRGPEAKAFVVYDAMLFQGRPTSKQLGMRKLYMVYSGALWRRGDSRDEPIESRVRAAARRVPDGALVCVDIEHWPVRGPQAGQSIRKLAQVLAWMRDEKPNILLGYYGLMPIGDYWRAIRPVDDPRHQRWVKENQGVQALAEHVDVIFPSLYTYYDNPRQWRVFAQANLKQARQYGKPVYPFIWAQFHNSHDDRAGQYLPGPFWRMQLQWSRQHADGVVIWGGWQRPWPGDAPWWRETAQFVEHLDQAGCPVGSQEAVRP